MGNEVKITLTVDDKGNVTGKFKEIEEATKNLTNSVGGLISQLKAHWVALTAATAGIVIAAKETISLAKSIGTLADQIQTQSVILGVSTARFQELA